MRFRCTPKHARDRRAAALVDRPGRVRQHGGPVSDFQNILRGLPAVVIVNPLAGAGRAGKYLSSVRQVFEARRISAEFLITESAEDLESRARQAIAASERKSKRGTWSPRAVLTASSSSDRGRALLENLVPVSTCRFQESNAAFRKTIASFPASVYYDPAEKPLLQKLSGGSP